MPKPWRFPTLFCQLVFPVCYIEVLFWEFSSRITVLVSWRYLHWRAEVLAAGGYTVLIADLLGDESKTLPVDMTP